MQSAEQSFYIGNYRDAIQSAEQATRVESDNGRIHLFLSQANFAVGNFEKSASHLNRGTLLLPSDQWGFVVGNFKQFYGRNDYVEQTRVLSRHISANPTDVDALVVRGFQFHYLGYPETARQDFRLARSLNSVNALVNRFSDTLLDEAPFDPETVEPPTPQTAIWQGSSDEEMPTMTDEGKIIRLIPSSVVPVQGTLETPVNIEPQQQTLESNQQDSVDEIPLQEAKSVLDDGAKEK